MGMHTRNSRRARIALAGTVVALAAAAPAAAFQALPPGGQVNDDPAAGINKAVSVSGEDPTNADVVGGALTAGKPAVPWAIFRQQETNGRRRRTTRSSRARSRTARGRRAATARSAGARAPARQFTGSLNFDQEQDGEAPAIDFAGAGRTVPWATWYENTTGTGFGTNNVFASRFDNTGDANQGKWIFGGQSRGTGGGTVPVPSLNIHTDQDAENPSVAGGSAVDPTKPGPVGDLAGDDRRAGRTARTRSSSRGRSARARRTATASRRQASTVGRSRARDRRLLLPADRDPARRAPAARTRASTSTRRATGSSRTSRSPAPQRRRPVGRLVREGTTAPPGCTKTRWCSPPRASTTKRRRRRLSLGSRGQPAQRRRSTPPAQRVRTLCRIGDQRGRVLAEQEPEAGRRGPAGGGRHDEPGQPDRPVGGLG